MGTRKLLCLDKEEQLSKTGTYHIMLRGNEKKAYSQKKKIMGNSYKSWPLKLEDVSKSQNKYYRDDLILNLKKKFNLSIREIAEILGINRDIVSRVKV